ncbi:MAG: ATP-grasp domain-containing protein, partial [Planctomycetota bacterium]
MKIHEYQAKELLSSFGIPVPRSRAVKTVAEAVAAAEEIGGEICVIKAQVHAGGRGKGRFVGTDVGGVKVVKDRTEIEGLATTMLGGRLVTHQTGEEGSICNTVLIEKGRPIEKEFYLAVILDRTVSKLCVMASSEGGMDIEEV